MTAPNPAYPSLMLAAATRIAGCADDLRCHTGLLERATIGCPWDGAGARAFRRRAAEARARLVRTAALLDEAAVAVRVHGDRVADLLATAVPP